MIIPLCYVLQTATVPEVRFVQQQGSVFAVKTKLEIVEIVSVVQKLWVGI